MHSKSAAGDVAGPTANRATDLELVCYGAGYAGMRPERPRRRSRRYVLPSHYVLTELGRRALRLTWITEHGPNVAEVVAAARQRFVD